jgi:peptidyl-prolyl cis-trans isomerase A (cyclophilin A)
VVVPVRLETALGAIVVQVEKERAPLTSENFLRYVDQKRFDGSVFYRAMKLSESGDFGLVQAGVRDPRRLLKPIGHEPTSQTGLRHVNGTVSMARAEPGTATSDFFIIIGDMPSLDARGEDPGYAAFGEVIEGMDVVRAIVSQPTSDGTGPESMKGQMLAEPVRITRARRLGADGQPLPDPPAPPVARPKSARPAANKAAQPGAKKPAPGGAR